MSLPLGPAGANEEGVSPSRPAGVPGGPSASSACSLEPPPQSTPLRIGSVKLSAVAVQAALSGYSDWPMRVMARRYGAAYSLAEVMIDRFVLDQRRGRSRTQHHLRVSDEERPVGGQLMGSDPLQFGPAAVRLVEAGFDVIDINFGCPVKTAVGRCRGGYHLSQPSVALEIVERVRTAVPDHIPVTVKLRRGIDDTAESRERFFEIVDGVFRIGAAAITVHGRTVEQRYVGPSDWSFLRDVKAHVGERTVIGSGDLFSAQACVQMLKDTGVDGVSIARGAIGNPWIFAQTRALLRGEPLPPPPTVHEQRDALREHYELAAQTYGPDRCGSTMKKFGIKYARLHPEPALVRDAFVAMKTPDDWQAVIARWYADDAPGRYPVVDETHTASKTGGE